MDVDHDHRDRFACSADDTRVPRAGNSGFVSAVHVLSREPSVYPVNGLCSSRIVTRRIDRSCGTEHETLVPCHADILRLRIDYDGGIDRVFGNCADVDGNK